MGGGSFLLVDDDLVLCEQLGRALRRRGYDVRTAPNYDEALSRAAEQAPHFAVIDLRMPGRSGLELARSLRALCPAARILLLTGSSSPSSLATEGIGYLRKPSAGLEAAVY